MAANISLVVRRQRAEFGRVSVFCYAQSLYNGASHYEDFIFQPRVYMSFCQFFLSSFLSFLFGVAHAPFTCQH